MKALFVVNERSGPRRGRDVAAAIRRAAACEYEITPCPRKEDLAAIVDRAEREGFDVVYAVGGDGTVHEMAKRLIGRAPALGVVPTGSGNGFARHLGLPMNPERAVRACAAGRIVAIDTVEVNGEPFVGVMGLGLDAAIAHRFALRSERGVRTYFREGLRTFMSFRAEEYEIVVGERTLHRRALVIAVANSAHYGNNARIAPLASLRDGLLDVVIIDDASMIRSILLMRRLFFGTIHQARTVTMLQAPEATIRRASAGPAHLDGEPRDLAAELHVRVNPLSLKVLVADEARAL